MSEPGCPAQNDHPSPMPQPEGPAPAPPAELQPVNQPDLSNPVPHQVQPYTGPAPAPEPAELQPENQPAPGHMVINPAPHQVQPYTGSASAPPAELPPVNQPAPVQLVMNSAPHHGQTNAAQNNLPNLMPEGPAPAPPAGVQPLNQPAPVQLVMNPTGPSNPASHHGQPYTGPAPAPPAELQPVNQPAPVHPDINPPGPSNLAPHQVQPYAELQPVNKPAPGQQVLYLIDLRNPASHHGQPYAAQNNFSNLMPHGPALAPEPAELQPVNKPAPGQLVMYLTDQSNPAPHQVQPYIGPEPAELQPVNQPAPGHPVINPAPHHGQTYTGPTPVPPAGVQPVNQPAPVQLVMNPPGPSNPASHQVQPYAAPAVPPLAIPFGVPPGLEYLIQIDQILIHQKVSCVEMFTGFETNNQYEIKNSLGQEIFHAKEKSDCFIRNFCGPARNFQMQIRDNEGQEVIRMNRPMRCFLQEIEVQAPVGVTIGYVKQEWSCFLPKFSILGLNNEVLLKIHGPFLPLKCCGDINFEVKGTNGGNSIGRIIKQRSGFLKKCFTDASNFCIQFPLDMDVKMKTVLLGACFLIDIMFFDKGGNLFLKMLKAS